MIFQIPLAWLQLIREKIRFLVAIAGIAFAVILIFMQLGFRNALYESATAPHRNLKADLVLLNFQSEVLYTVQSFPREHLYQVLMDSSVESVSFLYVNLGNWKNPQNHRTRSILILAFDPAKPAFKFPDVNQNLDKLKLLDVVIFDRLSRPEFGPIAEDFEKNKTIETEVNGIEVKVGGLFGMGTSFSADGNLITSDSTFFHLFKTRQPEQIDVGLINLKPGTDRQKVIKYLSYHLPNNVKLLTVNNFAKLEKDYWENSAALGFIFSLGAVMGFIVGAVIVYQIIYTEISEHLSEYATLKAMGYKHTYLLGLVFQQALILAVLGYIPGLIISQFMYDSIKSATNLPVFMNPDLAIFVLILTFIMCFISGAIAMRKLRHADPADLF